MKTAIRRSKTIGFTLIELLIVVAVIAILAALLFPVFARVREGAKRASCQSNLKQIGLAIHQYTQDYDEKLPYSGGWEWSLQPYVKSLQMYKCPSDTNKTAWVSYATNQIGYSVSWNNPGPPWTRWYNAPGPVRVEVVLKLAQIHNPADRIMMADNNDNNATQSQTGTIPIGIGTINQTATPRTLFNWRERHLDTLNVLFLDGHVKAQQLEFIVNSAPFG